MGLNPKPTVTDTIKTKAMEVNGSTFIVYTSDWMIEQYKKFPTTIIMDGTHGTNKSKFVLISFMVTGYLF